MQDDWLDLSKGLQPGMTVQGRYRIEAALGVGGVADVYRATQLDLGVPVAFKLMRPDLGASAVRHNLAERLVNEAMAAARVQHDHVIRIREVGRDLQVDYEGRQGQMKQPWLVMDLLQGHTLADELLTQGPMGAVRALPLFLNALDGLAEAHRQNIVHKDLKPSNLFLTHPGTHRESLVILDFGAARIGDMAMTLNSQIIFTPCYIAPEYFVENKVSPAMDVYQMGLILVEMLTGRPAVPHESVQECISAHTSGALDIPPWLINSPIGPIIASATATDVGERIAHAGIFYKVLSRVDPAAVRTSNGAER